jgi:hypothetical protein
MDYIKPKHFAEANTQAEIYRQCKEQSIECYLEHTYKNCRFDIVIVKGGSVVGIVEVKQAHHVATKKRLKKQREKYLSFGVPVHVCFCLGDVPYTMKTINAWINNVSFTESR